MGKFLHISIHAQISWIKLNIYSWKITNTDHVYMFWYLVDKLEDCPKKSRVGTIFIAT